MSQKVDINQTDIVLDKIGASSKTKVQLIADYPSANEGQMVMSDSEMYLCTGTLQWKIFRELSEFIAYKNQTNTFELKQIIESGGLVTQKPSGSDETAELQWGALKTTNTSQEIDPTKYIPVKLNGQVLRLAVLRDASLAYYTHNFVSGISSGAACSNNGAQTAYYSTDSIVVVGTSLFTNIGLTVSAAEGYYSDGDAWYQVDGTGEVIAKGQCDLPTTNTYQTGTKTLRYLKELGDPERTFNFNLAGSTELFNIAPSTLVTSEAAITAEITLNDVGSSSSTITLVINANAVIYANNALSITDGTEDFPGFITGQGTSQITVTFVVGVEKGRVFNWGAGSEIVIGPTNEVLD